MEQGYRFQYFQIPIVQILGTIPASPLLQVMLDHQYCEEFQFIPNVVSNVRTTNDNYITLKHQAISFVQI
jgi:hypothetical protein